MQYTRINFSDQIFKILVFYLIGGIGKLKRKVFIGYPFVYKATINRNVVIVPNLL